MSELNKQGRKQQLRKVFLLLHEMQDDEIVIKAREIVRELMADDGLFMFEIKDQLEITNDVP